MLESSGITVHELLSLEIMKKAKVLAGENGLDRRISKVNVMEVPDIINWVSSGEFLITTAYSIKDDISKLDKLIKQLDKKHLAGIGIKTKRFIKEVPKHIIDTANKLGFPLIEIPQEVSHSEIIMPALTEIIDKQIKLLYEIDNIHNTLINVMLKGGSLKQIAAAIYESIDNTFALIENIFGTSVIFCDDSIRIQIEQILSKESSFDYVDYNHNIYNKTIDKINGRCVNRIKMPIYTKERNYGFMYIWEDKKPMTAVELTVIEASISIIALDLEKRLSIFEIESKHKIEFFEDLFSNDKNRHDKSLERASYFNFNSKLNYAVIVISLENVDELTKYTAYTKNHLLNVKLISIIDRISRNIDDNIIYGNKSDRLIILYGLETGNSNYENKNRIMRFCNNLYSYFEKDIIEKNISIGIGRCYNDTTKLWKSYREANRAIENSKDKIKSKPIHYDDLGIYRILSYDDIRPELQQFYNESLEPLVEYDKQKGTNLVETLRKYFEFGGNSKRVSEKMYTHYNTIVYRMHRIKEITGINLDNYEDRLNFEISLKIYDMLNKHFD